MRCVLGIDQGFRKGDNSIYKRRFLTFVVVGIVKEILFMTFNRRAKVSLITYYVDV